MGKYRSIDITDLRKSFRIVNGGLEKYYKRVDMWKVAPCNITKAGYRYITYNGKPWRYCRLLYVLYTGQDIPEGLQIDHINGVRHDDRIENLRVVTPRENSQNKKIHRKGKLAGVSYKNGRYYANITIGKERIYLGSFTSPETARNIYSTAVLHLKGYKTPAQFRKLVRDHTSVTSINTKLVMGVLGLYYVYLDYSKVCKKYIVYVIWHQQEIYIGAYEYLHEACDAVDVAINENSYFATPAKYKQAVRNGLITKWQNEVVHTK